jgi:hypothetical protein
VPRLAIGALVATLVYLIGAALVGYRLLPARFQLPLHKS